MTIPPQQLTFSLHIDAARCTGCGRCAAVCREHLISLDSAGYRKVAVIAAGSCTGCLACAASCIVEALHIQEL